LICTPISLTAQRNGGTRQRNAFQPLQFAPANAVPFIRGLKRSTIRTVIPIPDRHRSGRRRFHSASAARLFTAGFNGMGLQSLRHLLRKCHLPLHKGGYPPGCLGIPLPSFSAKPKNPPFVQPQTADPSVCYADISPNRGVSSGKAALRESFFRADNIRPYVFLIILHCALKKAPIRVPFFMRFLLLGGREGLFPRRRRFPPGYRRCG